MAFVNALVCFCLLALAAATDVEQCTGKSFQDLSNNVQLSPCKKAPCRLKKGTSQHITITFTPETEVKDVKNKVSAEVYGVPLPFIGVDGNSICDKLQTEAGEKASCPLQPGTKYIYKDSFPVHNFYPTLSVKVNWSLVANGKDIICFQVPARIA